MNKDRTVTKRWDFYIISWDKGTTYTKVADTNHIWPVNRLYQLAKKLEFTVPKRDSTLVGGYFTKDNGDCLVVVPYGMDPDL